MAKEAYYFSHDCNARNDPKTAALRNIYKSEGYGWYWIIIETMGEQEDYKLKHCAWVMNGLAMAMLTDAITVEKFVDDCINTFELFRSDGKYFWSDSLIRRMTKKEELRNKRSEAGKKGAQKVWENSKNEATPKQCHNNDKAKDDKGKEKKGKENIYIVDFEKWWKHYPKKAGKEQAQKYWQKLMQQGWTNEQLICCAVNYGNLVKQENREPKFIKQADGFLNPEKKMFKDYLDSPLPVASIPYRSPDEQIFGDDPG